MAHLPFWIHGSAFGPGQKTYDLQLLHFTFQVANANPPWQWCARDRAPIQSIEDPLKISDDFDVAITELPRRLSQPQRERWLAEVCMALPVDVAVVTLVAGWTRRDRRRPRGAVACAVLLREPASAGHAGDIQLGGNPSGGQSHAGEHECRRQRANRTVHSWSPSVSKPRKNTKTKEGELVRLELTLATRRHLEPKASWLKSGPCASPGLTLAGRARQSSRSSAGCSQKEEEVQKESAETQEHELCQQNEMEVDRDDGTEELSFVPSAASDTAGGWPDSCATKGEKGKASSFTTSPPFCWRMKEKRTRSTSTRCAPI